MNAENIRKIQDDDWKERMYKFFPIFTQECNKEIIRRARSNGDYAVCQYISEKYSPLLEEQKSKFEKELKDKNYIVRRDGSRYLIGWNIEKRLRKHENHHYKFCELKNKPVEYGNYWYDGHIIVDLKTGNLSKYVEPPFEYWC